MELVCHDNGVGFDRSDISTFVGLGHFGLVGMRERIELLGGTMRIDSNSSGTRLSCAAPAQLATDAEVPEDARELVVAP